MGKIINNQSGFTPIMAVLVLVIVGLVGFTGWYVYDSNKKTDATLSNNAKEGKFKNNSKKTTTTDDKNSGYLVVKEWNIRFKIPEGLEDVKYVILGDELGVFAKPTGSSVELRSDYSKSSDAHLQYALGYVIKSKDATMHEDGVDLTVEGKKVGSSYYYTGHSFSALETGSGYIGTYSDSECDNNAQAAKCKNLEAEELKARNLINKEGGLLVTIEESK